MAEIDDLKKRVLLLERETAQLRGMVHALLYAAQNSVIHAPLMAASRSAKGLASIRRERVQGDPPYLRGFQVVAKRLGHFGETMHSRLAPEVAEFRARYEQHDEAE